LFKSVPKSIKSETFKDLPTYDYQNDKDVVMNPEFFAEGTKYTYCKLDTYTKDQTFEGLCSPDPQIPAFGRTISKTAFYDGEHFKGK
jgi:hypothetical protein